MAGGAYATEWAKRGDHACPRAALSAAFAPGWRTTPPSGAFGARTQAPEEPRTRRSSSSDVEHSITAASALESRWESGGVPNRSAKVGIGPSPRWRHTAICRFHASRVPGEPPRTRSARTVLWVIWVLHYGAYGFIDTAGSRAAFDDGQRAPPVTHPRNIAFSLSRHSLTTSKPDIVPHGGDELRPVGGERSPSRCRRSSA